MLFFYVGVGSQPSSPFVYKKNQAFKIDVLKTINCNASSVYKLSWKYYKGYYYDELFTVPAIKSDDQFTIDVKAGTFPYGVLKICATIAMKVSV